MVRLNRVMGGLTVLSWLCAGCGDSADGMKDESVPGAVTVPFAAGQQSMVPPGPPIGPMCAPALVGDYGVISAAVRDTFPDARQIVMLERSLDVAGLSPDGGGAFFARPDVVNDFLAMNQHAACFSAVFPLGVPYALLSQDRAAELLGGMPPSDGRPSGLDGDPDPPVTGWGRFYQAFPGAPGIIGVSRVGFSLDGGWALLYLSHQSDALSGAADWILLARDQLSGAWIVTARALAWVS